MGPLFRRARPPPRSHDANRLAGAVEGLARLGAGLPGAVVASFATVIPQAVLLFIIGRFFFREKRTATIDHAFNALRPGVAGLIGAATVSIFIASIFISKSPLIVDPVALIAFVVVFILRAKRINILPLVFLGAGIGVLGHLVEYLAGT